MLRLGEGLDEDSRYDTWMDKRSLLSSHNRKAHTTGLTLHSVERAGVRSSKLKR